MIILLVIILGAAIYYGIVISQYNKTAYKAITHNSYFYMKMDKGRSGEYDIYNHLKHYEAEGYKFLFNAYLPKEDGQTTELDVMMIGPEGVFVFESKNYNGWIFGNDHQKNWTQVLPAGRGKSRKEHFYNPVWQNRTHCKVLKNYLPEDAAIRSIVLFSDSCTFKDVTVDSDDVIVAHRRGVESIVRDLIQSSQDHSADVDEIYEKLYQYTQVSDDLKQSHADNINSFR